MSGKQERRHPRQTPKRPVGLQLEVAQGDGKVLAVPATLIDFSDYGCGLQTGSALNVGEVVTVKNLGFPGNLVRVSDKKARVAYCRHFDEGVFRSGLAFEDQPNSKQPPANGYPEAADSSLPDYYEVLQVSPKRISTRFSASTACSRSATILTTPTRAMTRDSGLCCRPIVL